MRDNTSRIIRLREQIADIEKQLDQDKRDGHILRAYVRNRLEDYLETLQNELDNLVSGFFENIEN